MRRNPEKDYWTEAVVFTTSNNSFGPTEISYLENRFCNLAIAANRYEVKNGNDPTSGNITEDGEMLLPRSTTKPSLVCLAAALTVIPYCLTVRVR